MAVDNSNTLDRMRKDKDFLNSEYQRAQQVINDREKQGLDISAQQRYLNTIGNINQANWGGAGLSSTKQFDQEAYLKQFQDQVNNMYNQQKESQLAQLRAQRDQAVGQINQQKAQVAPQYQGMRNQTDAVNLQNVQKLREAMANAGLTSSGENVTAQVNMANQRQNSLNSLNLQEQQTIDDLDRRIADLNNPASENALIAQLEAERARALLDLGMQADQIGYSRGRDQIMDNRWQTQWDYGVGRDQVADNQWKQQFDYQLGRDRVEDSRWREQWEYGKQRDAISDQQRAQALQWEKQQFQTEQAWRSYVYNNMSASEKAQLEWNREMFGDDMAWKIEESNRKDKLARDQMAFESGFLEP
ncbi:hypothetical protein [Bacillus litorisediminis]|uniref:hypothetical protein n=1 Tax=Bacillus litorisediminis TaxID=2922713 RepID=UPI001FAB900A|nr:hypothetical protein [Bacillus litorisediminis]